MPLCRGVSTGNYRSMICTERIPVRIAQRVAHLDRQCHKCDGHHEPHTLLTTKCTVCTRYDSMVSNAKRPRRDGHSPGVAMTLPEFARWFAAQRRVCSYCHIPEELVASLGLSTQTGERLQRLGLDRIDGEKSYSVDNIVLCCFACNKAKSNTVSTDEMYGIGKSYGDVWEKRLAAAGQLWQRCPGYRSPRRTTSC